jgi:curli biogenesis system outer membrane secretion channel CsgG
MQGIQAGWRQVGTAGVMLAAATLLSLGASPSSVRAQAAQKPTVAVIEFDNAAMVKRDEFAAMTIGVQVMLTNALAVNPAITVVEREKILQIIKEQDLAANGRVDAATAARIGKIVGARYVLLGAFVVDPSMEMRLSVRAVNSETSVVEYVQEVSGKGDKVFKLVDQLAAQVNAGLKLPGTRDAKSAKELGGDGPNQLEAMKAMSAARRLEEQGDLKGAITMYQKSLQLNSELGVVRLRLASLEKQVK